MTNKTVLWGLVSLIFLGLSMVFGIAFFGAHLMKDLDGARIEIKSPLDVNVQQTFNLEITVHNQRPSKALQLTDLDLSEDYLNGFTVLEVTPSPKSNIRIPLENTRSYTFDIPISPGKSQSFVYTLRAEKEGIFRGDVDACEDLQFITEQAQTVVKKK